jgi:hypothetical protein
MGTGLTPEGGQSSWPLKMNWKAICDFATLRNDTGSADGSPVSSRKAEDHSGLSAVNHCPEGHRIVRESLFGFPDSRRLSLFWPPDRPWSIIFNCIFASLKYGAGASWLGRIEEWRCRNPLMSHRSRGIRRRFLPSSRRGQTMQSVGLSVPNPRISRIASKGLRVEARP